MSELDEELARLATERQTEAAWSKVPVSPSDAVLQPDPPALHDLLEDFRHRARRWEPHLVVAGPDGQLYVPKFGLSVAATILSRLRGHQHHRIHAVRLFIDDGSIPGRGNDTYEAAEWLVTDDQRIAVLSSNYRRGREKLPPRGDLVKAMTSHLD